MSRSNCLISKAGLHCALHVADISNNRRVPLSVAGSRKATKATYAGPIPHQRALESADQPGPAPWRAAATIAGTASGTVVGTHIGNRNGDQMYRIRVKMGSRESVIVKQRVSVAALKVRRTGEASGGSGLSGVLKCGERGLSI